MLMCRTSFWNVITVIVAIA